MASAARPMVVRQCCRVRNSNAEISVPACATPTHQTKLTMSQPHIDRMIVAPDADAGGNLVNQASPAARPSRKTPPAGTKSTTRAASCLRRTPTACPSASRGRGCLRTTGARRNSAGGASRQFFKIGRGCQPLAVSFRRRRCKFTAVLFVFFRAERRSLIIRHRRVRIADARQIGRARLGQQIAEHGIIPRAAPSAWKPCCPGR